MTARRVAYTGVVALLIMVNLVACAPEAVPTPSEAPPAQEATLPPAPPTPSPEPPTPPPLEEGPVRGGTLTVALPADIAGFDPPVSWGKEYWTPQTMVYSMLYRFKYGTAELEPDVAANLPQVSEDGMTWTVPLRQDVKFSNGEPLTARDVKYTWDRMLDDETGGWAVSYYFAVRGAEEAVSGEADGVEGVKVVDDYTIQFDLNSPIAYFGELMAMPWVGIVNQAHVEAVGEDIAIDPLGSGPYVLSEFEPGVRAVFDRNPYYYRSDEPYADRVVLDLVADASVVALQIEKGEVDAYNDALIPADYELLKQKKTSGEFGGEFFEAPGSTTFFLSINSIQEPLSDLRVRQAIAHAIDRERMIRAVESGYGTPAYNILAPSIPLYFNTEQPRYEYDPGKAKELLAEAGYPDGFTLKTVSYNYFPWDKMAQVLQADLEAVGIRLDLSLLEKSAANDYFAQEENGLVLNAWPYEIPDPSYILDGGFTKESRYNFAKYTTLELEEMLTAARVEKDIAKRAELYKQLDQRLAYDLALWIPLYYPAMYYVVSENLGGFQPAVVPSPRMTEPWRYWVRNHE